MITPGDSPGCGIAKNGAEVIGMAESTETTWIDDEFIAHENADVERPAKPAKNLNTLLTTRLDATGDTILVADDDPDTLRLIEHYLERMGYTVVAVADGEAVFTALERVTPDLILLDRDMPKLDGFQVCRRLRSLPEYAELPVIFLTASIDPASKAHGFAAGADDYLTKPFDDIELLARIRSQLALALNRHIMAQRATLLESVNRVQGARLAEVRSGQEALLVDAEQFPELELAIRFHPAHEAGGDFYDIIRLDGDMYGLFVSDVSGHDLSVPFVTGALKALTSTFVNECLSPRESMTLMNASLRKFLSADRYVTAIYALYARGAGELEFVVAGHPPAVLQRRDGRVEYLEAAGDVLGMFDAVTFDSHRVDVAPGDRLFLFSDGLVESATPGVSLGLKARLDLLCKTVADTAGLPVAAAADHIVSRMVGKSNPSAEDDVILLVAGL